MVRAALALLPLAACQGGKDSTPNDTSDTGDTDEPPVNVDDYHTIELSVETIDQDIGGQRVTFYMPDDPIGVLFAFHGTNGSIFTVMNVEWIVLYNALVPHGVGLVFANSQDRVSTQWDVDDENPNTNPDMVYLTEVRDWLVENTGMTEQTPIVSAGFSNGATFAYDFTGMAEDLGWDVRAFLAHNGGAQYEGTQAPGFFTAAENDESGQTVDLLTEAADRCSSTAREACPFRKGHEIPLQTTRFARMPYFTQDESREIFDDLVGMEIVDPAGERLVDIEDMEDVFVQMMAGLDNAFEGYVDEDLRVVWATHRFSSEHVDDESEWLLDRL